MSWVRLDKPKYPLSLEYPWAVLSLAGQEDLPAHDGLKTSVDVHTVPWACHCEAPPAMYLVHKVGVTTWHRAWGTAGRSTRTAQGMGDVRGVPKQHAKEPLQRKEQGRTVKAAADKAPGFRGPMFHFNSTPRLLL